MSGHPDTRTPQKSQRYSAGSDPVSHYSPNLWIWKDPRQINPSDPIRFVRVEVASIIEADQIGTDQFARHARTFLVSPAVTCSLIITHLEVRPRPGRHDDDDAVVHTLLRHALRGYRVLEYRHCRHYVAEHAGASGAAGYCARCCLHSHFVGCACHGGRRGRIKGSSTPSESGRQREHAAPTAPGPCSQRRPRSAIRQRPVLQVWSHMVLHRLTYRVPNAHDSLKKAAGPAVQRCVLGDDTFRLRCERVVSDERSGRGVV